MTTLPNQLADKVDRIAEKLTQTLHLRPASGGLDSEWMPSVIKPYLLSLVKPQNNRIKFLEMQVREQKKLLAVYEKMYRVVLPKLAIEGATSTDLGRLKNQIHRAVEIEKNK